ncbi:MAG: hypothetical protein LBO20_10335, partial [Bifidobacteriaceae bacterium]|nr:hypothetical protein [Bifidobacteriaceae bacterium]
MLLSAGAACVLAASLGAALTLGSSSFQVNPGPVSLGNVSPGGVLAVASASGASEVVDVGEFSVTRLAPSGTETVWVDVEAPGLAVDAVELTLVADGSPVAAALRPTVFGLTAVAAAHRGDVVVTQTSRQTVEPVLAVTFADANGLVLDAWNDQVRF